ncbi:amino acid ABC transporter substrate-binding protein, PAAT family [Tistlia consotensis]|uniref:Amino acid ABC transporter substrate-binding protein, PAAT family n=1 Tax=Tistlia consotensis USBA 355 TaxID=560819 RepID=A0A1Y6BHD7_9PROT|nr:lysine/arginine/ornithine ABC transporter substrate-binding protein [Tistlia consotensis]SMF11783.1 amino acid ABC transporter substrate-binding protein, PAAT family [Tistlia consotensis USBA 355]SNR51666.1 amino acid ABC transporter substrate-binding protein, PAAT family [Tistlia consotensis]
MRRLLTVLAALTCLAASGAHAEGRKVRIGTEGAYPPFNYIDASGRLKGFDIDIARALCEAADFDCSFVIQDWDGMIPGLLAKKYDAIIASMSITDKRKQIVAFTDSYYNTPAKFVKPKALKLEIPRDLKAMDEALAGLRIGVQRASSHEAFVRGELPAAEAVTYPTLEEAELDLVNGRLDLVVADSVVLQEGFLKTPAGQGFAFVGPNISIPKYHGYGAGIALRKGDDALREAFNAAIRKIRADGTYQKINARYFDFDVFDADN